MIDTVFIKRNWAVKKRENMYSGQPYQCLLQRFDPGSGALWLILIPWLQQLLLEEVCLSACKNWTIKAWIVTHTVRIGFETMGRNRTLNSPLPCIICCCMLLNFFSNTVKIYILLGCMVRDNKSNAENGKMPA